MSFHQISNESILLAKKCNRKGAMVKYVLEFKVGVQVGFEITVLDTSQYDNQVLTYCLGVHNIN